MLFQANKLMLTHSLVSTVLNTFFNTFVPDKKKNKVKRKNFKIFPSFSNVYYLARLKMFNLGITQTKKKRVWNNPSLSPKTKLCEYQACVLSTLLYSSEAWTTYARHDRKLNTFHLRCLLHILCIKW